MEEFSGRCQAKSGSNVSAGLSSAVSRIELSFRRLRIRSGWMALCTLTVVGVPGSSSGGSFDTVINVPPDLPDFSGIHSNTQVNVTDGGRIGAWMQLGSSDFVFFPF